ncbi:hypothetical protein MAPG_06346 [Magnaporthiopsis poae ATCC 64411]|uniref:Uncharacterized protein n=1 Tax=Magnaporthiopsis poae (strain ATCC 64411 / 73-15) TaxID=644358 RepID=A0A0C4E1S7_MAGP6|nr:hypothetical protein MAPG_06346 [Magnaporthiopsis poae ATCC 64411]
MRRRPFLSISEAWALFLVSVCTTNKPSVIALPFPLPRASVRLPFHNRQRRPGKVETARPSVFVAGFFFILFFSTFWRWISLVVRAVGPVPFQLNAQLVDLLFHSSLTVHPCGSMTCAAHVSLVPAFQGGKWSEDRGRGSSGLGWLDWMVGLSSRLQVHLRGKKGKDQQGWVHLGSGFDFQWPVAPGRTRRAGKDGGKREREANGCHGKSWLAGCWQAKQAKLKIMRRSYRPPAHPTYPSLRSKRHATFSISGQACVRIVYIT